MTLLAAATATDSRGLLAVLVLLWLGWYVLSCIVWPFVSCRWCEGGRKRSPSGRAWRACRRCRGTGRRIRAGRKLWTGTTKLVDRGRR